MKRVLLLLTVMLLTALPPARAAERTIGVFVALADNQAQGIVPVPAAIGNGDDSERNLYWGTAEGLKGHFDQSKGWKLTAKTDTPADADILRTRTYRNAKGTVVLQAFAYRGGAIKRCIQDFETAVRRGSYDLVVFVGHNGLMDFELPLPARPGKQGKRPDCVVLCCKSEAYFKARLVAAGGRPILLTTQLMYPGSFILSAVAERWAGDGTLADIRAAAGAVYAANQKLSQKAALGVFADLKE